MNLGPDLDLAPLASLVQRAFPERTFQTERMPGGASTRRYLRVHVEGGGAAVGMFAPEGHKAEEIEKEKEARRWPFLEVRDLLHAHGVDVPALLGEDTERGWLLLEDLGDETLANVLAREPERKTDLYVRAVTDLAHAQARLESLPETSIVRTRCFDEDLLRWELDHFREWGVEARGKSLGPGDRDAFEEIAQRLAKRIASWPRGFTHRDYQSRNLMVRPGASLAWIDFQDALLGPRIYDLVALLNDSYQSFTRDFVEARLDDFARAQGLDAAARRALTLEFDLVTVQRKLKDAGRFVFIDRVKQNPSFLKYVVPTLEKAMGALERLAKDDADMARLLEILARTDVTVG